MFHTYWHWTSLYFSPWRKPEVQLPNIQRMLLPKYIGTWSVQGTLKKRRILCKERSLLKAAWAFKRLNKADEDSSAISYIFKNKYNSHQVCLLYKQVFGFLNTHQSLFHYSTKTGNRMRKEIFENAHL